MPTVSVTLREFRPDELIFDAEESREILKFMFKSKPDVVAGLTITDSIRSFAQGLLLEAVDASFTVGFVEALVGGGVLSPGAAAQKILRKFAQKAFKHWFQHATTDDLRNIKIYEIVRRALDFTFVLDLDAYSRNLISQTGPRMRFVAYRPVAGINSVWA